MVSIKAADATAQLAAFVIAAIRMQKLPALPNTDLSKGCHNDA
jgi:hypothetical protein